MNVIVSEQLVTLNQVLLVFEVYVFFPDSLESIMILVAQVVLLSVALFLRCDYKRTGRAFIRLLRRLEKAIYLHVATTMHSLVPHRNVEWT